jgi:hypothetical protein
MRKKWTGYALAFSLFVSLLVPVGQIKAADTSVRVTLPDFAVNLNGHKVENQYREYPLLVYKGITYFPMTWNDTRMLGLEAIWTPAAGLTIKQNQVTSSYAPNKSTSRNSATYTAKISTSVITVNGKVINNSKEQYPLLSFRNVAYFPLTWHFVHDEFGWDYKWNDASGLSITSHNSQLQTVGLSAFATDNDVALFKGYYYFVESKETSNHVYRAPVNQPTDKKEIYAYSFSTEVFSKKIYFQIRDNTLWFKYSPSVGITTGYTQYVKISDSGKTEAVYQGGFLDFRDTPYGSLIVGQLFGKFDDEIDYGYLSLLNGTNRKNMGENLMYSNHVIQEGRTATTVVGDDVYVLFIEDTQHNFIYKINLKTNKTEKIVSSPVRWFQIIDNKLIYVKKDEENALFSSALDGMNEMQLSEHTAVSWFDIINGNLFYTTKKKSDQFELYKVNSDGKDTLLWTSPFASVHVLNGKLVCQLGGSDGVVILDGSGSLQLKVADPIKRVLTSDNGVLLQNSKNSSFEFIH